MKLNLGLKLGSKDTQYTDEIKSLYNEGVFQYIELFSCIGSYDDMISYWRQFDIPFGIHAAHSAAGLNLADKSARKENEPKIAEAYKFADALKADYVVFHSGTNGNIDEAVFQLKPFSDERLLIENKPAKGLDGSTCVGCTVEQLQSAIDELHCGSVLDFGHAICAANTFKQNPIDFIKELMELKPRMFHLTDGDYYSELDSHFHYGKGSFPLNDLLTFVPVASRVTNEAKRAKEDLSEVLEDSVVLKKMAHEVL